LAAPAAINEILLQSWGGIIRVFPALKKGMPASFTNLRTQQGHLVSASKDKLGRVSLLVKVSPLNDKIVVKVPTDSEVNTSATYEVENRRGFNLLKFESSHTVELSF